MLTESYSASCYIENKDGQYHMECDMQTDDHEAYSEYDGNDFIVGLNTLVADLQNQILKKPEPEPETPEEKIARLEELVKKLENEKIELNNTINSLITPKEKKDIKSLNNNRIDDIIKNFEKYFDKYLNDTNQAASLYWPYKDVKNYKL